MSCTTFDDLKADPDLIGEGSSGAPGGTCPNPPCVFAPDGTVLGGGKGAECKVGADCASTICQDGACTEPLSTDGVKDGTETDVDCGGTAPTNAPKCLEGKTCKTNDDCHWGTCNDGKCGGDVKGQKDGDQTDIDCGGAQSPPCDWGQGCLFDRDCGPGGKCGADKKCLIGPSCDVVHGGATCGAGEFGDATKQHESCCKSLLVDGFTDAKHPGKLVYLDKYEITAGRMRAFLETLAKANDGAPNVKDYMAAHRPVRWNPGWENLLPIDYGDGQATFTVSNPTADPLYPGLDFYTNNSTIKPPQWTVNSGTYTVDTGVYIQLGAEHFFPEYAAATDPTDYAATHNLNCTNVAGSYGMSTYWFDNATVAEFSGGVGKAFPKDVMDEKSLNCTPFGLFAAFCAWDGGELMTAEVFDAVAGGPWPSGSPTAPVTGTPPPRLTGANQPCGGTPKSLITTTDGADDTCLEVYNFPNDNQTDYDGTNRIAAPGRVAADVVAVNGNEWHDLKGNLVEAVLLPDNTFSYRGYGIGYSSLTNHTNQISTPRMKGGSFGARCMRFRDKPAPK
jgi:hypothetical protein